MSLLKLKPIKKSEFDPIEEAKATLKLFSLDKLALEAIVFGSASRDDFSAASDIDALVVLPDLESLKKAQKLVCQRPYSEWPIDWLLKTKKNFEKKSEIGGVCYIAKKEGLRIL